MKTAEERKETDRKRLQRHRKKLAEQGKKSVNAVISKEAYEALSQEKERTGESNSAVIERLLLTLPQGSQQSTPEEGGDETTPLPEWDF